MDETGKYFQKLYDGLLQQFKDKPNLAVFQKAMARQLDEVYTFYYALLTLRWLQDAEGVQLGGIGNIVDLSRMDALIWSHAAGQSVPMDDNLYRLFLWFKVFLNTSEGTYADVVKVLKMFWPYTPIYYSEYIERPATMFFTTPTMPMNADLRVLQIVTRVKAAGVALHFVIPTEPEEDVGTFFATGAAVRLKQYIDCDPVELPTDAEDCHITAPGVSIKEYINADAAPLPDSTEDCHATAPAVVVKEYIITDGSPIPNDGAGFGAAGTYQTIKEVPIE